MYSVPLADSCPKVMWSNASHSLQHLNDIHYLIFTTTIWRISWYYLLSVINNLKAETSLKTCSSIPALLVWVQAGTALWISVRQFLRKLRNNLPQDPVIPLWGIYLKDAQSYHKDMCSTMFIAAFFVIARTWKQPKCPLTKEWIRKMWYIYTMEYYTAEKMTSWNLQANGWS